MVPEGIEVYAAANGTVIGIKGDSNVGGDDLKYWDDGNYIIIEHTNEYTEYMHLKFKGVVVKVGDKVKQGQVIGYSGNTGYSDRPHLHFECQKYFGDGDNDYVTLKARFKDFKDVYISKAISKLKESKGFRKERFESSYKDVIIIKKKKKNNNKE